MKPHPFPRMRPVARAVSGVSPTPLGSSDTFKLERRREPRVPASGLINASYSDGESNFGITRFEVLDRSSSGLQVRTTAAIRPGMRVDLRDVEPPVHGVASGVGVGTSVLPGRSRRGAEAAIAVRTHAAGAAMIVGLRLISQLKAA